VLNAGLDIGTLWTKAVVLKDGELAGFCLVPTGEDNAAAADSALSEALKPVGAAIADLGGIVATGAGKDEVPMASETATEVLCAARGIRFMHPSAEGVIDMGGESTRVVKLDGQGNVAEFALNDKCAAGTGVFLDEMASVMGVKLEDMGPLSLESTADVNITSTCVVFAESEVVSQVARKTPTRDILRGIHRSIATRVFGLVGRIGMDRDGPGADGRSAVIGGLARNVGIVSLLEEMMKEKLTVPENPQIVSALGAALIASDKTGKR
jgi:predicted CoA-substrate-specific enzyme activase